LAPGFYFKISSLCDIILPMRKRFLGIERIYTISELNILIRNLLREEFPEYIWVCGEVQDLRRRTGKPHIYFKFVQKHPELDEVIAQIKAIIFEEVKDKIFSRLKQADSQFELKNNIEIKALCKVDFYSKRGELRLFVFDIDPFYTLGKLAQARNRIIESLKKRGLLEKNKRLKFPLLPLKIGLITSFDSAAFHDFINELKMSNYGFKVFLYNSYMQGKFVEDNVIRAIDLFNQEFPVDVIVITRGGGSTADLGWFDNEKIAERIANSSVPVISALGHQINITVCDLVAYTSLKTPTKVAQFLVEKIDDFNQEIEYLYDQILDKTNFYLEKEKKDLETKVRKFDALVSRFFLDHHTQLAEAEEKSLSSTRYLLEKKKTKLKEFVKLLEIYLPHYFSSQYLQLERLSKKYGDTFYFLEAKKEELVQFGKFLSIHLDNFFKRNYDLITSLQGKIRLLDPRNVLKRGYSITFKEEKAIKDAFTLKKGDKVRTVFFRGGIKAEVEEIDEEGD